jgi:N-methylhydantoinase A
VEAVAVCLLHAYANTAHEVAALEEIRRLWPEVSVVASHQITREWREYERTNTAVLSAYVQPVAARYLGKLDAGLKSQGLKKSPCIMQSNRGVDSLQATSAVPINMVESGPASGFWGAAELGKLIGEENILALDIGGTTAKCSLIEGGEAREISGEMIVTAPCAASCEIAASLANRFGVIVGRRKWVDQMQTTATRPWPTSSGQTRACPISSPAISGRRSRPGAAPRG